ncbi:hypothetical protein SAY86_016767 [Trapa natans]|uniref:Uncharacterized protein n=1 Tax=Trapa natans TaxID=22666 RepID=A0AAN7LJK1_TRANT|nr:hypothetical protein SAY86_016767 [Trapa natans]
MSSSPGPSSASSSGTEASQGYRKSLRHAVQISDSAVPLVGDSDGVTIGDPFPGLANWQLGREHCCSLQIRQVFSSRVPRPLLHLGGCVIPYPTSQTQLHPALQDSSRRVLLD